MILVTNAKGGLYLRRDDDEEATPLFVAESELADVLAQLLAAANGDDDAQAWDAFCYFQGNDAVAIS